MGDEEHRPGIITNVGILKNLQFKFEAGMITNVGILYNLKFKIKSRDDYKGVNSLKLPSFHTFNS